MPRVHHVKKARKDNPVVKAGEPYYWWKFRFGGKRYSKTYPKQSQLTQSEFLSTVYGLQEEYTFAYEEQGKDVVTADVVEADVEELKSQLEELRDETEDRLSNMPDHLQDSSDAGMLLQERIDGLEEWINQLDSIDFEDGNLEDILEELRSIGYEGG